MTTDTYRLRGVKPADLSGVWGDFSRGVEVLYFNGESSQTRLHENDGHVELVVLKPFDNADASARYARGVARYLGARFGKRVTLWSR